MTDPETPSSILSVYTYASINDDLGEENLMKPPKMEKRVFIQFNKFLSIKISLAIEKWIIGREEVESSAETQNCNRA